MDAYTYGRQAAWLKLASMTPAPYRNFYPGGSKAQPMVGPASGDYNFVTAVKRGAGIEAAFASNDARTGFSDNRTDLSPSAPLAESGV